MSKVSKCRQLAESGPKVIQHMVRFGGTWDDTSYGFLRENELYKELAPALAIKLGCPCRKCFAFYATKQLTFFKRLINDNGDLLFLRQGE